MQTNRRRDARTLISIAFYADSYPQFTRGSLHFWAFHYCHFFFPSALVSFHFARIGLVLVPCCSAYAAIADTNRGHKKTSLRVPKEAVRIALIETQREVKTHARFLCQVSSIMKFSNVSFDDCFAALLKSSCHSALAGGGRAATALPLSVTWDA